jgi:signal transduction histidine kinase
VLPLLLARQMFFRTRALEVATKELQDREVVLRALSNHMAEERQDERMQIAAYLHDDLAQILYRLALHLDVVEADLRSGDQRHAADEVERLRATRNRAQELLRALIKDLHRSPLGRAGLSEALESFGEDVQHDTGIRVHTHVSDVEMPPPVQLLCYHVAREAVMNALKHASPETIHVDLEPTVDGARLTVTDDGAGFDPDQDPPEGHYGVTMMRERAQVAGGAFRIDSAPGRGTTVTAEFPTHWLAPQEPDGSEAATSPPTGDAPTVERPSAGDRNDRA